MPHQVHQTRLQAPFWVAWLSLEVLRLPSVMLLIWARCQVSRALRRPKWPLPLLVLTQSPLLWCLQELLRRTPLRRQRLQQEQPLTP